MAMNRRGEEKEEEEDEETMRRSRIGLSEGRVG